MKRENDTLRQRVRELEASLKEIRQPPSPRERAESFDTTDSLVSELRQTSIAADPQAIDTGIDTGVDPFEVS